MDVASVLRKCPLFAGADSDQLRRIQAIALQKEYRRGDLLFAEGQKAEGFYLLLEGKIKLYKLSAAGKEQILHILGPGEPFAEAALFAGAGYPAFAEALADSRILYFPKRKFLQLLQGDPQLSLNMLATMAGFLKRFSHLVERLSLRDVSARLAQYLLQEIPLDSPAPPRIKLKLTKSQLAAQLGTVSETLSRTLKKFRQEGIITVQGRNITILDRRTLQRISGTEEAEL